MSSDSFAYLMTARRLLPVESRLSVCEFGLSFGVMGFFLENLSLVVLPSQKFLN